MSQGRRHLLFLDDARLLCEELHPPLYLHGVEGAAGSDAQQERPVNFLNQNGLLADVVEAPLHSQHPPIGLDAQGGCPLLVPLFFSFAIDTLRSHIGVCVKHL